MKVFHNMESAAGKINKAVVTTGSFDGVHIGHKVIIKRLNQLAKDIDGESVLVTFYPHPRKVLYPEQTDLRLINSQDEKIDLLSKTGLDNLVIIPFSKAFAQTTSHDFVKGMLVGMLQAHIVVVGHNHHFGHNREGDYSYLHGLSEQFKFQVEEIPLLDIENETVSSTKIRRALKEGNMQRANAYLDHPYVLYGPLSRSSGLIAQMAGFPTWETEVTEKDKLIPPNGIYAANLFLNEECHKVMTFIHQDKNGESIIESHLLYEQEMDVTHKQGRLFLYKKVMNAKEYGDEYFSEDMIPQAKEMVDDLIF
jgi:riboflavin kinase / FMN adenylyltransferase